MEENKKNVLKINKENQPYVIIRGKDSGVFAGFLTSKNNQEITLDKCRRLWYWDGAASISQIAICGVSNSSNCKFTIETNAHQILDAIEIIPCSEFAHNIITHVAEWKK